MTERSPNNGSQVLEIVRIRCTEATYHRAETALLELLTVPGDLTARLVRSAEMPHDLALHIRSGSVPAREVGASPLGLRIAAELRDFGPVSHSVWIEIETTLSETPPTAKEEQHEYFD